MSGWSTSRTTIFAARRVLPPDLIVPAEASAPRMKLTGPLAVPPPASGAPPPPDPPPPSRCPPAGERLPARADPAQVDPRARAALEDRPLLDVPVEDRAHRVVDREDEARAALLRRVGHAHVEPHRRVESRPPRHA